MKLSDGLTRFSPSVLVYTFFAGGASLQKMAMRHASLGVSSLFVLGLESVLAFGLGGLCFDEDHSLPKFIGVGLIVAGIILLHWEGRDAGVSGPRDDRPRPTRTLPWPRRPGGWLGSRPRDPIGIKFSNWS